MSATLRQPASVVGNPSQVQTAIRVVLADDHATLRRTLRLLLESEQDVEVIAEAVDLSAVVDHVSRHAPRVLVLDLRLPAGSNIAMIAQLRKRFPGTEVVVMTMEESPLFAQRAIDAGATGFVVTDRADTDLVTAVRLAARGQEYVSARVASGLDAYAASARDGCRPPYFSAQNCGCPAMALGRTPPIVTVTMEPSSDQPLAAPFPRCGACRDVIGVYEPMVHVFDGLARQTSLAAEPQIECSGDGCYHLGCYGALGDGL